MVFTFPIGVLDLVMSISRWIEFSKTTGLEVALALCSESLSKLSILSEVLYTNLMGKNSGGI
jgi:hypothetical protein